MVREENRTTVVVCAPIMGRDLGPLRAFEPRIELLDGNEAWDAYNAALRGDDATAVETARGELTGLLRRAEVLCMAFPALRNVGAMSPNLRWLHHTQAGVSNLWPTDIWASDRILLTSGRGHVRPTAMAEYAVAGALHFARGLHDAGLDKRTGGLDRGHYQMQRVEGSTMGVVGLGGIGKEVARLSRALGMRVVATRRSAESREENVNGANVLLPASELGTLAAESDFIAVCTQLTRETMRMIGRDVFARMKPSGVIINVSRGEVIDEDALIETMSQGRLRGAVLDVYEGELAGKPPRPELLALDGVVMTPHVSAGGSTSGREIMELFRENLRRYLDGEPLLNLVDPERGY